MRRVRQVLATNLMTDALPAFAVAVQRPERRSLAGLDREGEASLDAQLRRTSRNRAIRTAGPALLAYALAARSSSPVRARAVGCATIVTTQLPLTLESGRASGALNGPVIAAVAGPAARSSRC